MTRRCSHCSHNGHNSRTCPNRGVKLFGVRLTDGSIRKSASMGNLTHYMGAGSGSGPLNAASPSDGGYTSEDFVAASSFSPRERKKGVPWTEEEHRLFLVGLQKLGKGDWRGIARNYVVSRTPTQVASHAQKYFIRQINVSSRRKRRSSLFDIVALADHHESVDNPAMSRDYFETLSDTPVVPPDQSVEEECESMESANSNDAEIVVPEAEGSTYPLVYPAYVAPVFQMPIQFWPAVESDKEETHHQVVKPTAVLSKKPINVDELVGMSKLCLGESLGDGGPSILSLQLVEGTSTRPSAFHASNPAATGSTSG